MGVHHEIVVDVSSENKWVVFEWGRDGEEFYACAKIGEQKCMDLGRQTMEII